MHLNFLETSHELEWNNINSNVPSNNLWNFLITPLRHLWNRPGKSCKLSSSGKFRVLECPQNRMIGNTYIKCWFGMIESSKLDSPSSILYFPYFFLKSPLINLNFPSSALLPPSSVKRTGNLTENVLKITEFPTKCPKAPLAPLVAFSRFEHIFSLGCQVTEKIIKENMYSKSSY